MRNIDQVYIHCSACPWGDFTTIDSGHRARNFPPYIDPNRNNITYYCGYHWLVYNPFCTKTAWLKYRETGVFNSITDGKLVPARPASINGAHVSGVNYRSVGLCAIGYQPTPLQLETLYDLSVDLILEYDIDIGTGLLGHHEYYLRNGREVMKTCPNMDMTAFRKAVEWRVNLRLK